MPQRKNNDLYLWNYEAPEAPVYTFTGHSDTPTEFIWRNQASSAYSTTYPQEYQLVTWSKDMHIRMWPISEEIRNAASYPQIPSNPETPYSALERTMSQRSPFLERSTRALTQEMRANSEPRNLRAALLGEIQKSEFPESSLKMRSSIAQISQLRTSSTKKFPQISEKNMTSIAEIEKELEHIKSVFPNVLYIDKVDRY